MEDLIEQVKVILNGIDKDECYDDNGWWGTLGGAEFGKKRLEEVIEAIKKHCEEK